MDINKTHREFKQSPAFTGHAGIRAKAALKQEYNV